MLSSRVYSFIGIVIPLLSYIGAVPCEWKSETRTFIHSRRNQKLYQIHTCLLSLPICAFLALAIWFREIGDHDRFSIAYIGTSACLLVFEVYLMLNWFQEETLLWLNQLFRYLEYINRVYLPSYDAERGRQSNMFELGGILIWIGAVGGFLISTLVVLLFPRLPMFLGYFVPQWLPFIVQLPCLYIPQIYVLFMSFAAIPLALGSQYCYGFMVAVFFTHNFLLVDAADNPHGRRNGMKSSQISQPGRLIQAYRVLQIVNQNGMNIVGPFMIPTQLLISNWVIVSVYMIWKNWRDMQSITVAMIGLWAILSSIFWCCILVTYNSMGRRSSNRGKLTNGNLGMSLD